MSSRLMHYASTSFDVKLASYENIIKDEFVYSQSNNKVKPKLYYMYCSLKKLTNFIYF